ncbi:MAG: hypothetical protein IKX23_11005 [Treponema sp.]|nr:hypothetical protein [Treponema sp.]
MKKLLSVLFFALFLSPLSAERPVVRNITASYTKGTKINVYWELPEDCEPAVTRLLVYRTTFQVSSYNDIIDLEPVVQLSADASGFTDKVSDYRDYFYTVISFTSEPYKLVLSSMNTTVNSVHIKQQPKKTTAERKTKDEPLYSKDKLRQTPLPFLDYTDGIEKEEQISDETAREAMQFSVSSDKNSSIVNPYYFEDDLVSPDGGDDYILFEILKNTFVQEKYEEAVTQLTRLTKTNISKSVQNRAFFYIGEAQYFLADYEASAKAFAQVSQVYPLQTRKWINNVLDKLVIEE